MYTENVIDLINVSPAVVAAWHRAVQDFVARLPTFCPGLTPDQIPDEAARVEPDGSLTLYVLVPAPPGLSSLSVSITIPAEHWAWRDAPTSA